MLDHPGAQLAVEYGVGVDRLAIVVAQDRSPRLGQVARGGSPLELGRPVLVLPDRDLVPAEAGYDGLPVDVRLVAAAELLVGSRQLELHQVLVALQVQALVQLKFTVAKDALSQAKEGPGRAIPPPGGPLA